MISIGVFGAFFALFLPSTHPLSTPTTTLICPFIAFLLLILVVFRYVLGTFWDDFELGGCLGEGGEGAAEFSTLPALHRDIFWIFGQVYFSEAARSTIGLRSPWLRIHLCPLLQPLTHPIPRRRRPIGTRQDGHSELVGIFCLVFIILSSLSLLVLGVVSLATLSIIFGLKRRIKCVV